MTEKTTMLFAVIAVWMFTAVAAAALPFTHTIAWLKTAGTFAPLLTALAIGAAVGVPLSLAVRRLSGLSTPPKNAWGALTRGQAAVFGIVGWGFPLGLLFAVNEFLATSAFFILIPAVIIWSLAGIAFGLTMRWFIQRAERGSQAA